MREALARFTAAQRTTLLLDLLAAGHCGGGNGTPATEKAMAARQVFLTEVAPGTGFASGYADAVAVSLWHSDGLEAEGYEIKASRADLRRELADLGKWQRVGRYCSRWWLVVWDRRWLDDERIPVEWGLLAYQDDGSLAIVRKASALPAEEWPRDFVASLLRRAAESAPCAALLERMRVIGYSHGRGQGLSEERNKWHAALEPLLPLYRASEPSARYAARVPMDWVVGALLASRITALGTEVEDA